MAECEKMMRLCEESLDRGLAPEEQAELDRHLETCPACADYLADLRFLTDTLNEAPELPAGLHERIMSGIENEARPAVVQQPHRRNRKMPVSAMLVAAAACVVLALSGGLGSLMNNFNLSIAGGGSSSGSSMSGGAEDNGMSANRSDFDSTDTAAPPPAETAGTANDAAAPQSAEAPEVSGAAPQPASYSAKVSAGSGESGAALDAGAAETGEPAGEAIQGRSAPAPESSAEAPGQQAAGENEGAPAIQPRLALAATEPQVGAFIADVMSGEVFAGCYLVEGGSDLPSIGQEQQRDANFAYFVAENNLSQLENLLDALEKAGCTVTRYDVSGVVFNDSAKRVIFVVRLAP